MDRDTHNPAISRYLDEVTEQIAYKPLRPSIRQELEAHIEDCTCDYTDQGEAIDHARQHALHSMGDAVTVGIELNEIHQIQKTPWLSFTAIIMLLAGFALSAFMQWTPEQMANGFFYYIPGGILLLFTIYRGYPLLVSRRKPLAFFIATLYLLQTIIFILTRGFEFWFGMPATAYFATLLLIPLTAVLLYCTRKNRLKFSLIALAGIILWSVFLRWTRSYVSNTATVILLLSVISTIVYMVRRRILQIPGKYLYPLTAAAALIVAGPLFLSSAGQSRIQAFLHPRSVTHSTWQDSYNALLIQELLSKTPMVHGLQLQPEEMMSYGTGEWYFASRDPMQIGIDATGLKTDRQQQEFKQQVQELRDMGYRPKYIHYTADTVMLWDILPQHYHNNYLVAVCIFLFGWVPGVLLIGIIALFFILLFRYINRIHGHLASALAFSCGQCLLWQGIFYILGNFGYQYAEFPNLPLISEGRLSIIFNMLLLGLIISACRHDHVMEEPLESPVFKVDQTSAEPSV